MGAAAYQRGSALISKQFAADRRAPEFVLMDELNALEKFPDAGRPFGPVTFSFSHGGWWAMCPTTGFGYWYRTLREAVRRWHVEIVGYDNGDWLAEPNGGRD